MILKYIIYHQILIGIQISNVEIEISEELLPRTRDIYRDFQKIIENIVSTYYHTM